MPANAASNHSSKHSFSQKNRFFASTLVLCGVLLVFLSLFHRYLSSKSLTLNSEIVGNLAAASFESEKPRPLPVHISMGGVIDSDISSQVYQDGIWTVAEKGVSYLAQSARTGEAGNIIMYGHNTTKSLSKLKQLKKGDIISIKTDNGTSHFYSVTVREIIDPEKIEYIQPTSTEILTIYTCAGPLDSKRLIIQAEPTFVSSNN